MESDEVLRVIVANYLDSRDFNGLPLRSESPLIAELDVLTELIRDGLIETISEEDFPNPHIRPWSNQRAAEQQVKDLHEVARGLQTICLYPTRAALAPRLAPNVHAREPYSRRLAEGSGQLEPVYFDFAVLEQYRNDPAFRYRQWDFGLEIHVTDAVYLDDNVPERDKTGITVGYAYNVTSLSEGPIVRRACAFMRDLADLTPEHQRRWETYEVQGDVVLPHPEWARSMSGHFPEGIGPFECFMSELEAVNDLSTRAFGEPFFSTTERPAEFGWITRASTQEWNQFVLTLDKLISDNIRSAALDAMRAPSGEENGERPGTLRRLERFMVERCNAPEDNVREVLKSWREVRRARQNPAHRLEANTTDDGLIRRQADLIFEVTDSLRALRIFLAKHPKNRDWSPPPELEGRVYLL